MYIIFFSHWSSFCLFTNIVFILIVEVSNVFEYLVKIAPHIGIPLQDFPGYSCLLVLQIDYYSEYF